MQNVEMASQCQHASPLLYFCIIFRYIFLNYKSTITTYFSFKIKFTFGDF
ncbi:unnamed protein product [Tenebrio molitor]|nr:unnamed protein product [Tenebrio molitor]